MVFNSGLHIQWAKDTKTRLLWRNHLLLLISSLAGQRGPRQEATVSAANHVPESCQILVVAIGPHQSGAVSKGFFNSKATRDSLRLLPSVSNPKTVAEFEQLKAEIHIESWQILSSGYFYFIACYFKPLMENVTCGRKLVRPGSFFWVTNARCFAKCKWKMMIVQIVKVPKSNSHWAKCASELKPQRFQLNWRKHCKRVDKQVCEAINRLRINYREEMCNLMCVNRSNALSCLPNIVWKWWKRSELKFCMDIRSAGRDLCVGSTKLKWPCVRRRYLIKKITPGSEDLPPDVWVQADNQTGAMPGCSSVKLHVCDDKRCMFTL